MTRMMYIVPGIDVYPENVYKVERRNISGHKL